jgi:DNA-binding NarL/FixJ family response regulator
MNDRIRVALVDDQALFRAGIRLMLSSQDDIEFVGEAANGAEGVALARERRPDVILMDIRMPVMDGIDATAAILAEAEKNPSRPGPRIIVLTTFNLDESATKAIRSGASGFLLKNSEPDMLLASIRAVHAGSSILAAAATRELFEHFDSRAGTTVPPEFEELTARERDIFRLATQGLSNAEIAAREFLGEATVKTHVGKVLSKLHLRDRVQLVVYAYENGLVE